MALTITSVTPNTGLTQGREFVLIQGTDFNTAVDSNGSARMEVYFGPELATRVRVRSATELDCLTPIHDPGQVNVKVKDLDASTEATLANGYTFSLPVVGGGTDSDLVRIVETLINELKRQINVKDVIIGSDVDFDGNPLDGLDLLQIAEVPSLVLEGPRITESGGPHHRIGEPWEETSSDVFQRLRPQDICDLEFQLSGVDNHKVRLLNILRDVISFFRRNNVLRILRDASDPSKGYEEIDMRPPFPADWRINSRGNKSSLKYFTGIFTLVGVTIGYGEYNDEVWGITDFDITSLPL